MQARRDRGTLRVRLLPAQPCVARVTWYADGRRVGSRRLWHRETDLFLPAGTWTLEVTDEKAAHDPTRLAATRARVVVRAGWRTTADVVLERGAALSGTVRAQDGTPARFATVVATLADGRTVEVRADGRGEFTLAGLPETTVLLRATKGTWQSLPSLLEPRAGRQGGVDLALTERWSGTSRSGAAELRVGAAFTGLVVDPATGAPAYAAIVELRDARGVLLARTRADHRGRFVVGGDLTASSGLTLVVASGPDRIAVDRKRLHGLSCGTAQLVDLGTVALPQGAPRPRPERHHLARTDARALSLPATRV
jgi:hypothetical protein